MIIHTYRTKSGKDSIMDYINSLTIEEQVDGLAVLECMERAKEIGRILGKKFI